MSRLTTRMYHNKLVVGTNLFLLLNGICAYFLFTVAPENQVFAALAGGITITFALVFRLVELSLQAGDVQ